ncbi:MAG: bifunctional 4-hydroxy-3-methylbut-2-enyl diphosphate reductase/30S ribosomal protein S1 [Oscillospiraceae bacterium]|nr:bifunctional 4-hydroxy-3-methylbut-2-enyl diphosphate reductase/30S ribosomal protein S1 [Oscillospiraceae bacterium]
MNVIQAQTAGFCFGVDRAVAMVERAVREGKKAVTLGPIIHNRHVVRHFAALGVQEIASPDDAPPDAAVIIRSHGVPRAVYEALRERGAEIIDATCPFVARIHKIVASAAERERRVIIIGTRSHPEVTAIAGWCADPLIFETAEELQKWAFEDTNRCVLPYLMVFQTTSTQNLWINCRKIAKKLFTNCEIFDTICEATEKRQEEALELAARCDAMVVVGDASSSNTGKLAAICRQQCRNVSLVDCADDLDLSRFSGVCTVGLTAGASTPSWIIKEVNKKMSEEIKVAETAGEENFAELLEQSIKTLNNGDKVTGIVTAIGATEIQVDLGTKHAGYIPIEQLSSDPDVKPEDIVKVGDEIEVVVVRVNDVEGTAALSKKRLEAGKAWDDIEALSEEGTVIEAPVTEENKGGVVANYKGVRIFLPASQTGIPKGGDLGELVNQNVQLRITEVNRARKRVVGSIRDVAREARRAAQEKVWSEIEVGKKYLGKVKSLTSYGAFVDIGGVDGMVHVSELSWNRIKTPADVVKVGDEIEVFVISYDPEKHKISLGHRTPETNPWTVFQEKYHVGDVVPVKIVKLMTFGAFAEIMPGIDGLIHISQIENRRIGKPEDILSEGQEIEVKITDIDAEHKRISLSRRALLEPEAPAGKPEEAAEEEAPAEAEENVLVASAAPGEAPMVGETVVEEAPVEEAPAEEAPAEEAPAEEAPAEEAPAEEAPAEEAPAEETAEEKPEA